MGMVGLCLRCSQASLDAPPYHQKGGKRACALDPAPAPQRAVNKSLRAGLSRTGAPTSNGFHKLFSGVELSPRHSHAIVR